MPLPDAYLAYLLDKFPPLSVSARTTSLNPVVRGTRTTAGNTDKTKIKTHVVVRVCTDDYSTLSSEGLGQRMGNTDKTKIKTHALVRVCTDDYSTLSSEGLGQQSREKIKPMPLSVSARTTSLNPVVRGTRTTEGRNQIIHFNPICLMMFPPMEMERVYFYTATILQWQKLLKPDKYKDLIISSLQYLVQHKKIAVYAFVIMPNHIHLIWEILAKNGKEMPHASFMKYTAHELLKDLQVYHPQVLPYFQVGLSNREYQFWERNSLPVELYSKEICEQKIEYIHANPIQEKWSLCQEPADYRYSSALFYETLNDKFGILTHYKDRF